jgi:hypothetical protein
LVNNKEDRILISDTLKILNRKYQLNQKIQKEPGVQEIIDQMIARLGRAFGNLKAVKGKRVLDIACGSNSSFAPSFVFVETPLGERKIPIPAIEGYTAQFEPWMCRILLELGAEPVGIDIGDLEFETFEHYKIDLGVQGALDFLPDHSFDAIQDSRLFGSPEFTDRFPGKTERLRVAVEIGKQELRLLKNGGIMIHSDAMQLMDG